jgi:hypothetical protein
MRQLAFKFSVLCTVLLPLTASADIIVSILQAESNLIEQGSTPQSVNVFARTTTSDTLASIVLDFELPSSGIFAEIPGTIKQPGMIGFETAGSSTSFLRDPSRLNTASASIEFQPDVRFPNSDQLIATLSIDPSGLALGDYPIRFLAVDSQSAIGSVVSVGQSGYFRIVSTVPEPGSFAFVSGASLCAWLSRRRRYRDRILLGALFA